MDKEVGTESEKKREKKMRTRGESNGGGRGVAPPPKSPFVTLGFQFPGKEQPPPPVLN